MNPRLAALIDPKTLRIVRLFLTHPDELYHIQKVSRAAQVPLGSTFRIMKDISRKEIIETVTVGKMKLYRLDRKGRRELEPLK